MNQYRSLLISLILSSAGVLLLLYGGMYLIFAYQISVAQVGWYGSMIDTPDAIPYWYGGVIMLMCSVFLCFVTYPRIKTKSVGEGE